MIQYPVEFGRAYSECWDRVGWNPQLGMLELVRVSLGFLHQGTEAGDCRVGAGGKGTHSSLPVSCSWEPHPGNPTSPLPRQFLPAVAAEPS